MNKCLHCGSERIAHGVLGDTGPGGARFAPGKKSSYRFVLPSGVSVKDRGALCMDCGFFGMEAGEQPDRVGDIPAGPFGADNAAKRKLVWAALLIAALFLITAGVFLGVFFTDYFKAKETVLWPSTKGQVEWSRITSYRYGRSNQNEGYHLRIGYTYGVDGKPYRNDRYSVAQKYRVFKSLQPAEEQLKQYPAGSPVTVFFNPVKPEESLLHVGQPEDVMGDVVMPIIVTGALALVAAVAAFLLIYMRITGSLQSGRKR